MLKTRVITALLLLTVLLPVLFFHSLPAFAVVTLLFFAAAIWESFRLFRTRYPIAAAILWCIVFGYLAYIGHIQNSPLLFALSVAIWIFRLIPSLAIGLPHFNGIGNRFLNGVYAISILACFTAMKVLFDHSSLYLLSVMMVVWVADIGAYFAGKTFGKHKLAPSISPGKSWEGAVGGWFFVMVFASASTFAPSLADTFAAQLLAKLGWLGFIGIMTLMVAASVVGDLFESQLKRRAEMKDSSTLLPGHGGVLDRIDALIPSLPLAALLTFWLWG
ncbi:MAG: phosphatidate cytidylyltransferase [Pseudomonadota bacterium]